MSVEEPDPEERFRIMRAHKPFVHRAVCVECRNAWPCDAARMSAAFVGEAERHARSLEEDTARIEALTRMLERLVPATVPEPAAREAREDDP